VAARLIAALLLLCLSPLAPALELIVTATQPATACSCCRGMKMCCCRRAAGKPGWNSTPPCGGRCNGTPFVSAGLAFVAPGRERTSLRSVASPQVASLQSPPRTVSLPSPLLQRPPPSSIR